MITNYPNNIEKYKLYTQKPNTIHKKGHVYTKTLFFNTKNKYKNRIIRVYLPSTYELDNPEKRFPVLYMFDGANLFDEKTSYAGEWHADETLEELIKEKVTEGFIIVGIDCPGNGKDREREMTPYNLPPSYKATQDQKGYADVLAKFLLNQVKKDIDEHFYTKPDRENTFVGGSSMGGLMAFYVGTAYKERVSCSLCFSPGFLVFKSEAFRKHLKETITTNDGYGAFYLYVGGQKFEKLFIKDTLYTFKHMEKVGFKNNQVCLVMDTSREHHESAWAHYLKDAFLFLINN